jgi:hypothetical protein
MQQEENQFDFNLYNKVNWKEHVRSALLQAPIFEIKHLYLGYELDQFRKQIFTWLENPTNEPKITPKIITDNEVDEFISVVSNELSTFAIPKLLKVFD